MPNPLEITLSSQISNAAAQTTLSLEEAITNMKVSGMADSAIRQSLLSDLNSGGPIFGSFRNKVKNTVRNGVEFSSNQSSKGVFVKAGVERFQWVTVGDGKVCPDCDERHGETGTMEYFELLGLPGSGFSVCGPNCRCKVIPANYKGENLDKPLVKEKRIIKSSIKDVNPQIANSTNKGINDTARFFNMTDKIDNIVVTELQDGEFARGGLVNGKKTIHLNSQYYGKNVGEYNRIAREAEDAFQLKKKQDIVDLKKTRDSLIADGNIEMASKFDKVIEEVENWRYSVATSHSNPAYATGIHESTHAFTKFHKDAESGFVGRIVKNKRSGKITQNDILSISDYAGVSEKELLAETVALIQTSGRSAVNPKILSIFDEWFDWYFTGDF